MTQFSISRAWLGLAIALATAPITAESAVLEPGGSITLREWGYRHWGPDLLHYRLEPAPPPGEWSLVDSADNPVQFQIDGKVLSFVTDLPRGATRRYRLVRGRSSSKPGSLRVHTGNELIEVENEYFTLRLPAAAEAHHADAMDAGSVPPPLLRWRPRGGPWMGGMRFASRRRVKSYEMSVVRTGPVSFVYEARYHFAPRGDYLCRIAVVAGLPFAEVTEELDGGQLRRDNQDFLIVDLHRDSSPHSVEVVVPKGEAGSAVRRESLDPYLENRRAAQFQVSSFGGTGQAPTPTAPASDMFLLERLFPAGRWGGLAGGIAVTAPSLQDEERQWRVGIVPLHVGDWRRAMALNAWGTQRGDIALALPLDARWAWWHLDTTDEQSPFSTHEHDPAFPESYARRVWGLFFGDHLESAQDRYGFIGLDRYKEWLLAPPPAGTASYPRAFVTPAIVDQIRAGLAQHPDADVLARYYLVSGRAADAVRHGREFVDWMRQQTASWQVHGLSHYRQSETLHRTFLAEDALSYGGLPQPMRREILAHLRLWAYLLSEADHNPRGAGVHLGNNNMTINRTLALAYFAALLPNHPRYHDWMTQTREFVRFKLATQTAVDGAWIAAPNYQLYGPARFLDAAINILRNTGYDDPTFADYHGRTLRYLAELTMADRRFNGLRILPGMGNSGNTVESIFGLSMRAAGPDMADMLWQMHRLSVGGNGVARLPFNAPHQAFNYSPRDAVQAPRLTSRLLPTYGMVFRNRFATDRETAMLFRAGSNWSHWDTDVFNVILYGRGAPLSPGTGYGYAPASAQAGRALYHNRIKLVAHDQKEIFGRVDAPIRDYALGQWLDYAVAERYYPPELYADTVERRWRRHVMFIKSAPESDTGADYFVLHDGFPDNPDTDHSWWTWLNPGEADRVSVSGQPFSPAQTPRNRNPELGRLPLKQGRALDLTGGHGMDTHIWFAADRPLSFRVRLTFDAAVHLPYDPALPGLDFSAHFPQGKETKTIVEAMAGPGEGYYYVVYPRASGEPLPRFSALEGGVIQVSGQDSTDTIFVSDTPIRYAKDGVVFAGRAGAVRVFRDHVVLALSSGSGEVGYLDHVFTGHAPFERTVPLAPATGRTDLGGYDKTWLTRVVDRGVAVMGEPPFSARLEDGAIIIDVDGRPRTLLLDRPGFIRRPRYLIDGREWMATWTDWPDSGFGRWRRTHMLALSVPAGKHRLVIDDLRFPPARNRRFKSLLMTPAAPSQRPPPRR